MESKTYLEVLAQLGVLGLGLQLVLDAWLAHIRDVHAHSQPLASLVLLHLFYVLHLLVVNHATLATQSEQSNVMRFICHQPARWRVVDKGTYVGETETKVIFALTTSFLADC